MPEPRSRSLNVPVVVVALAAMLLAPIARVAHARAEPIASGSFQRVWARTDQPVADGRATRTWIWGPEPFTAGGWEDYAESPGGQRQVQYFDKSRMEITNPDAVNDGFWYVTNGLLVVEMVTGQLQLGDNQFEPRAPAQVNVAGDPNDPRAPTYATFATVLDAAPVAEGAEITQRLRRDGTVVDDPTLAGRGVTGAFHVQQPGGLDHRIASPFWDFMKSWGTVYQDGEYVTGTLFVQPFYATGYPISEAYWTTVMVGGAPTDVLIQCFERRCLTYTPANAPEWQLEMGNVGRHYYAWRYGDAAAAPAS